MLSRLVKDVVFLWYLMFFNYCFKHSICHSYIILQSNAPSALVNGISYISDSWLGSIGYVFIQTMFFNFMNSFAKRQILNLPSLHFNLSKNLVENCKVDIFKFFSLTLIFFSYNPCSENLFIVLSLNLIFLLISHILFSSSVNS